MVPSEIIEKAKRIRLLICDVDGVLTSGLLYFDAKGEALKAFNVRDGLGLKLLQQHGIAVAIISARQSAIVAARMQELGVEHVYQGQANKLLAYQELCTKLKLSASQIAYIGDDLPDIPVLQQVALAITVPDAPQQVKAHAAWITQAAGGNGAVREVCDVLLSSQQSGQG